MGVPRSVDDTATDANWSRRALLEDCLQALNGLDNGALEQAQRLLGDLVVPGLHEVRPSSPEPVRRGSTSSSAETESSLSKRVCEQLTPAITRKVDPRVATPALKVRRVRRSGVKPERRGSTTTSAESESGRSERVCEMPDEVETKPRRVATPALKVRRVKPSVHRASPAADSPKPARRTGRSVSPAAEGPVAPPGKLPTPEAEEETEEECPAGCKVFPEVERGGHPGLPPPSCLPPRIFRKLESEKRQGSCKPRARLFVITCADGGMPSWFIHFTSVAPSWCDVVVYEMPGQATRSEETLPETLDEVFEDCWECLQPAFEQMAKGGPAEGCPFAFRCASGGAFIATQLSARILALYGLEPCCVFFSSMSPPSRPFLTKAGVELMQEKPSEFLARYIPQMAAGRHVDNPITSRFSQYFINLMLLFTAWVNSVDHIFHTYNCPVHIFLETKGYSSEFDKRTRWDFEQWKHWTTGPCEISMVDCQIYDTSIKFHPDVTRKLWAEFGKHSGVVPAPGHNLPVL